jgi:putative Mg2+ transporter-C (MgtC) family protein
MTPPRVDLRRTRTQASVVSPFGELDTATMAVRMALALVIGGAIGWDRQRAGKAAGIRTHMLISLGACLFVLVPAGLGLNADALSRAIQGVATGIGFLGAGVILHHARSSGRESVVKGLTSAAAIWLTAALGVVSACGLWRTSALAAGAALLILVAGKRLERLLFRRDPDDDQT